jgi:hypothetical protein
VQPQLVEWPPSSASVTTERQHLGSLPQLIMRQCSQTSAPHRHALVYIRSIACCSSTFSLSFMYSDFSSAARPALECTTTSAINPITYSCDTSSWNKLPTTFFSR